MSHAEIKAISWC